ncbi:MAG: PilZ domain-containing protein [Inhella sp.]
MNRPESLADLDIANPAEIGAWFQDLVDEQASVHLEGPDGQSWTLQAQQVQPGSHALELRLPSLKPEAPAWVLKGPVQAHATLNRIRLDFELPAARELRVNGGLPLLCLPLPALLRRHQRRQAFRVQPTSLHHPRAWLPRPGALPLCLRTADLSAGGLSLLWPASQPLPRPGDLLPGVELELGRDQRVALQLQVQHLDETRAEPDPRVGCAFVGLSPQTERQLALYLNNLQRRQRGLR